MNNYTKEDVSTIQNHHFQFLEIKEEAHTLYITLNRPEKKNALHPKMVEELAFIFHYAHYCAPIWNIVINANGDIFCAGADLKAMQGADQEEITSTIPAARAEILLGDLFTDVEKPILLLLHADVYAGGTFFVAGATHVIAMKNIKFSLSEVKRGLFPFQVMAALFSVMEPKKALKWCIMGDTYTAQEALENNLVDELVEDIEQLTQLGNKWIEKINKNSPRAIQLGMEAYNKITKKDSQQPYLMSMLMKAIQSEDGREGIHAFREKRVPIWTGK